MATVIPLTLAASVDEDQDEDVVVTVLVGGHPIFEHRSESWHRTPEDYVEDACAALHRHLTALAEGER